MCLIRLTVSLWLPGDRKESQQRRLEALRLAQAIDHPFSLGYYLAADLFACALQEDIQLTVSKAETLLKLCQEHRLGQWLPLAHAHHGWAIGQLGSADAGMEELKGAIAAHLDMGSVYLYPFFLAMQADIERTVGRYDRGLERVKKAQRLLQENHGHWLASDLLRRQGELLLQLGDTATGEKILQEALLVTRVQEARSLELRTATQLARLMLDQRRFEEAGQLMKPIHALFRNELINDTNSSEQAVHLD